MKRTTLYFDAPRQAELREESLPALGADEVLVETLCSAISAGTEMLVYQGRFPRDVETDAAISGLRGRFEYPLAYGYAAVGVVRYTGTQVDKSWQDKLVFAFQPHASSFIIHPSSLIPIPQSFSAETACFLPNMETAVNLVQDGAPILGERVMVFGQGVVGLLTASLLAEFPLHCLVTADCFELRRKACQVSISRLALSKVEGFQAQD
ncbi:MAG: oxidoreductase, partial [Chloroflexota bacterium]